MYAPTELHLLANSAGLDDDEVALLWQEARQDALELLGSITHVKYEQATQQRMIRLIEDAATADIPSDLVPWVMFDIHVAAMLVGAEQRVKAVGSYIKEHLPGRHAA